LRARLGKVFGNAVGGQRSGVSAMLVSTGLRRERDVDAVLRNT
jgi:hypothetical protein